MLYAVRSVRCVVVVVLILFLGISSVTSSSSAQVSRYSIYPSSSVHSVNSDRAVRLLNEINYYRRQYGLKPLYLSTHLNSAAQAHSDYMARTGVFDHYQLNGSSPLDRAKNAGYLGRKIKENIAMGQTSPEEVVQDWMQSSHHRVNMLSPDITDIGVGYRDHYWTLTLARR
jgi:uncharacterized protein YkwD